MEQGLTPEEPTKVVEGVVLSPEEAKAVWAAAKLAGTTESRSESRYTDEQIRAWAGQARAQANSYYSSWVRMQQKGGYF